jgi:hypothetical protein
MTRREAGDGGHSAFTDHRIPRRPQQTVGEEGPETVPNIVPWRQPPVEFATRNLGMGSDGIWAGARSAKQILSGYRTLTTVQQQLPQDSEVYNMLGTALIAGMQYGGRCRPSRWPYDSTPPLRQRKPASARPIWPQGRRRSANNTWREQWNSIL